MTTARHDPDREASPPSLAAAALAAALLALPSLGCVDILGDFKTSGCNGAECGVVWSAGFGDGKKHHVAAVAVDKDGTVFVAGEVASALDFAGKAVAHAGASDVFVASLDATGDTRWAKSFGGTGDDGARSLAIDNAGNVLVAGYVTTPLEFGTMPLAGADRDVFVAKLDPDNGELRWVQGAISGPETQEAMAVTNNSGDEVIVAGYGLGTTTYGGVPEKGTNAFALKLNGGDGAYSGVSTNDIGAGECTARGVAVDAAGTIYMAGTVTGEIDIAANKAQAYDKNLFAVAISNGSVTSPFIFNGTDELGGIAYHNGKLVMSGSYTGTISIAGKDVAAEGYHKPFYLYITFDPLEVTGDEVTGDVMTSTTSRRVASSAVGNNGALYMTGSSGDSPNDQDIYLVKVGDTGGTVGEKLFGGDGMQRGTAVAVQSSGDVILAGDFEGDFTLGDKDLESKGGTGMFVAKVRSSSFVAP